ncbi:MAG: hypothetical protein ACQETH_04090 [Candidatus Rifleibacteriota bacterium]
MPCKDGTGPASTGGGRRNDGFRRRGSGGGTGRIVLQFLLDNWKPILGFVATTLIPYTRRKLRELKGVKKPDVITYDENKEIKKIE